MSFAQEARSPCSGTGRRKGTNFSVIWPQGVERRARPRIDHSPGEKRYQSFAWRDAFAGGPFEELRFQTFPHDEEISAAALVARIGSWSHFASMPDGGASRRRSRRSEGMLTEPTYRVSLETHVYTTRRAA